MKSIQLFSNCLEQAMDENLIQKLEDNNDFPEPTNAVSGHIKAIGKDTVHKICSGQVVLSLAVAVKELVENAIDAEATLVEVKLREQGLQSVEVCDNGGGVEEHNLEGMTAKYHTSKIREFVDLQGVETFGFRGEALSSLCALSDMAIVTRHKSSEIGLKVELDHEGNITKRLPCARSVGTTVTLTNLFTPLPVRRRDFTRNIKKEFAKMCQILQAYCLVSKGVRIICTNHTEKGNKTVVLQTHGAEDVLANISAVFGSRQTSDLMAMQMPTGSSLLEELQSEEGDKIRLNEEEVALLSEEQFKLEGFISSCSHGAGRSAKDRQYFYINSRPCDPKPVIKIVNEIYRRFNVNQYPFVCLNIITARATVDVNLTPDKRQLLVHNEKILLLVVKRSLLSTFSSVPSTFKMQNATIVDMFKTEMKEENETANDTIVENVTGLVGVSTANRFMDVLSQWKRTGNTLGTAPQVPAKRPCTDELSTHTEKLKKINEFLISEPKDVTASIANDQSIIKDEIVDEHSFTLEKLPMSTEEVKKDSAEFDALTQVVPPSNLNESAELVERIDCKVPKTKKSKILEFIPQPSIKASSHLLTKDIDDDNEFAPTLTATVELDDVDSDTEINTHSYVTTEINTSISQLALETQAEQELCNQMSQKAKLERLRFKSGIAPSQNQTAEAELQREISKAEFARMDIIGQFNLGFIIVKLDMDIFIVDQHATDEKYNFEQLQRTTVLQHQPLAVPQPLQITAVNELVLLDHLEVFEKNGFKFDINENAPPTKKVRLLGKPTSKNWEFGKEDIDELIFMLQDAPEGTICRPSRIRAMFASRACRKSVMIGKALKKATMKNLITHMGEIEQPWNCPHGRPTMRHLVNIAMLTDEEDATTA